MADRKARLAALAAKAGRKQAPESGANDAMDTTGEEASSKSPPVVTFRNYNPASSKLVDQEKAANDDEEPASKRSKQEEPSALQQALAKAKAEAVATTTSQTENIAVVAPKKINWDLKRDVQSKLDKLERRTQKATIGMLKERLQKEASAADDVD